MEIEANRRKGYQLLHNGVLELARVEANGIRIDEERLARTRIDLTHSVRQLREELDGSKMWKLWRKRFGVKANVTSHKQLATIIYEDMGFDVPEYTDKGKPSTDEEALQKIDDPSVATWLRMSKYEKALGTFLRGIEKEVVNGRLHPVFNLHLARTYRSSSDSPNFQNLPVRDKEIAQIIRSLFTASKGGLLVENDFKGIEVAISACYHRDRNFIDYITTPGKDMHRDMAAQIFLLDPKDVSKDTRYGAKNKFVFPQFYGDFYVSNAKQLWDWIEKGKLTTEKEKIPLKEHLREQGITKLGACDPEHEPRRGTFEYHLKQVEKDFWNNRFREYGQWKRDWFDEYTRCGYFDLFTGFRIFGTFNRKQACNYPIQGTAFHCLLWSLIQINRRLRHYNMKSMVVGQIHDSMIGDVVIGELRDYLEIVEQVVTVELREHYKEWLIIPLEIECEIAPPEGTWFDKKEVRFKKGRFAHPAKPDKWTTNTDAFLQALSATIEEQHDRTL